MPRLVNHDKRRREICDVMLDIVAEQGVTGVTIRNVASRGGWSNGVIGHYFRDRQDLLLGGLRRAAEVLAEHNREVLGTLRGLQALEQILEGSIPLDRRRIALARIFFFFFAEGMTDESVREEVETYLVGWRKSAARAIGNAQEEGDLPASSDPMEIATELIGLVDGLSLHALLDSNVLEHIQENAPVRRWIQRIAAGSVVTSSSYRSRLLGGLKADGTG